jgi:Bacterial SH3 domain
MHAQRWLRGAASLGLVVLIALVCGVTVGAQQPQQPAAGGVGTVVSASPMYLTPDPSRTPLTTLQPGTRVRVLTVDGDWYRVMYNDRYLGERTGYVLAVTIRMDPAGQAPPPPTTGGVPGQVNPPSQPAGPPAQVIITSATPMKPQRDRGFISLNGTYQRESTAFSATSTVSQFGETKAIVTNYGGVHSALVDVAVGGRVWSGLYVVVGATRAAQITDAALAASVPHPVLPNSPRTVTGSVFALRRWEAALHVDAAWSVDTPRVQVLVFGGPSYFRLKQPLVTDVIVNETPPFNTVTFAGATVVESTRSRVGGNGGVDASVRVWKAFGVGAIVRYSEARIPFAPTPGTTVTIKAGGLQYGGGIRFRF